MTLEDLLKKMWVDYCDLNPAAKKIHDLFIAEGETVLNDHIALRTFDHPRLGLKQLAAPFEKWGYAAKGDYIFEEKKLYAKHYEHKDPSKPKIFISELQLAKCCPTIQEAAAEMIEQISESDLKAADFSVSGRPWTMSHKTYLKLAEISEYASWVAAIGFRPNHFTVNVNQLKKWNDLKALNAFIKKHGYQLNTAGGEIKGTPKVFLEQSSTMASQIPISFSDGTHSVPGCYYEFAKRYPLNDGTLYQGFVTQSADKIFESTNRIS